MNFRFFVFLSVLAISSTSALVLYASKKSQNDNENSQSNLESTSLPIEPKIVEPIEKNMEIEPTTDKNQNEIQETDLIENWDLEGTGLSSQDIAPFLKDHQPESIMIQGVNGIKQIYPKKYASGNAQSDKTLFLTTQDLVDKIAQERFLLANSIRNTNNDADTTTHPNSNGSVNPHDDQSKNENKKKSHRAQLSYDSYEIVSFTSGTRYDGSIQVPDSPDYRGSLNGPDYSFDYFSPTDVKKMKEHLATILPLGNNGILILQLSRNGSIIATGGFDFAVYQTTFRIIDDMFWNKFAHIGVSNTLDATDVKWYPCAPRSGVLIGCVGVVPTEEGGDQFSLSAVGLQEARYIWIKDVGFNDDMRSRWPTEGCALDALRVYHAYTTISQ